MHQCADCTDQHFNELRTVPKETKLDTEWHWLLATKTGESTKCTSTEQQGFFELKQLHQLVVHIHQGSLESDKSFQAEFE